MFSVEKLVMYHLQEGGHTQSQSVVSIYLHILTYIVFTQLNENPALHCKDSGVGGWAARWLTDRE